MRCGTTCFRGTTCFPRLKGRAPLGATFSPTISMDACPQGSQTSLASSSAAVHNLGSGAYNGLYFRISRRYRGGMCQGAQTRLLRKGASMPVRGARL